jgi:hypothetical protein
VRLHRTGIKHFNHPVVGRLELDFDAMELPVDTGLTMTVLSAAPGSSSEDALRLLASWAATSHQDGHSGSARSGQPGPGDRILET